MLTSTSGWATDLRDHRYIGDFTGWREDVAYQKAFSALRQHLKIKKLPTI